MRVLGIDPGLVRTGWASIESSDPTSAARAALGLSGARAAVRGYGLIAPAPDAELPARLAEGARLLRTIVAEHQPELATLEEVFTAPRHPRSALLMAHMRGVICLVLAEAGVKILPLTATTGKQRLTGSGHA